jgi:hypothetical protein
MRELIGAILFALAIGGCAHMTETVNVPVPVPCNPPKVEKPALPVDSLPQGSDIFSQVRALWATVETLEGYADQLTAALDACRD